MSVNWYLVTVSIYISLRTHDVRHLFMCLFGPLHLLLFTTALGILVPLPFRMNFGIILFIAIKRLLLEFW